MIRFVNAKINIGLQIVRKREDGYHDLQTVFFPVGLYAGSAENPVSFCDILELSGLEGADPLKIEYSGRKMNCEPEDNLVTKAAHLFCGAAGEQFKGYVMRLEKHLPDGAGMGGGSADASFTLKMLAEKYIQLHGDKQCPDETELARMALKLGADCPFFLLNRPAYASGVGERLMPIDLSLSGYWLVVIKPSVFVSTKDAFAGVRPKAADFDLRELPKLPISEWNGIVKNDFEESVFQRFPEIGDIKARLYHLGASYASMSGSGSSVYGIYTTYSGASAAVKEFRGDTTIEGSYLLKM